MLIIMPAISSFFLPNPHLSAQHDWRCAAFSCGPLAVEEHGGWRRSSLRHFVVKWNKGTRRRFVGREHCTVCVRHNTAGRGRSSHQNWAKPETQSNVGKPRAEGVLFEKERLSEKNITKRTALWKAQTKPTSRAMIYRTHATRLHHERWPARVGRGGASESMLPDHWC